MFWTVPVYISLMCRAYCWEGFVQLEVQRAARPLTDETLTQVHDEENEFVFASGGPNTCCQVRGYSRFQVAAVYPPCMYSQW